MTFSQLALNEPIILAAKELLKKELPATVTAFNKTVTDGYTVTAPAQYLSHFPQGPELEGGTPIIGVGDMPARFVDDLQFSMDAEHEWMVACVISEADYPTLVCQLRRLAQCVAYTIQQDRMLGTSAGIGGIMRNEGGVFSVNFLRTEPGPLLADIDPENPGLPPRGWISWTGLTFSSRRREV